MKKNKHTLRQGQTFFLIGLTEKDPDNPYAYKGVYIGTGFSDILYGSLSVKEAKDLIAQCDERIGLRVSYSRNKAVRTAKELNLAYKKESGQWI